MHEYEEVISKMVQSQINVRDKSKMLTEPDFKRINQILSGSIFSPTNCCVSKKMFNVPEQKRSYILFLLNGKKHPLQRLLYQNFIGDLKPYDCVKYKCKRTFVCYNIHHLEKKARKLNTDRKAWIPYCITIEFSSSSKFIVEF
jgi:hypothetical protein